MCFKGATPSPDTAPTLTSGLLDRYITRYQCTISRLPKSRVLSSIVVLFTLVYILLPITLLTVFRILYHMMMQILATFRNTVLGKSKQSVVYLYLLLMDNL